MSRIKDFGRKSLILTGYLILAILVSWLFIYKKTFEPIETSEKIPVLQIKDLQGKPKSLSFVKPYLLLWIWSEQCISCHEYFPMLKEVQQKFLKKIQILSLCIDCQKNKVQALKKEYSITYGLALGDTSVASQLKINLYPSLYVIDRNKKVVFSHMGGIATKSLLQAISTLK